MAQLKGSVHIKVKENVSLEHLQGIVASIVGISGCRTCGLLGVDLRLTGDPVEAGEINKIPGVQSVQFGE